MRITRYFFLTSCLSLALSNAYAMGPDFVRYTPVKPPSSSRTSEKNTDWKENKWTLNKLNTGVNLYTNNPKEFRRMLVLNAPIGSFAKEASIRQTFLCQKDEFKLNESSVIINMNADKENKNKISTIKYQLDTRNIPYIKEINAPNHTIDFNINSNQNRVEDFLHVFYAHKVIPDFAAIAIVKCMEFNDFRVQPEHMPYKTQNTDLLTVEDFRVQPEHMPYKTQITDLLTVEDFKGKNDTLNRIVAKFVNNDPFLPDLPEELKSLKDITVSADSTFTMLNIIREQQIVIQEKNKKLEIKNNQQ